MPESPGPEGPQPPLSRRALREARDRATTGPVDTPAAGPVGAEQSPRGATDENSARSAPPSRSTLADAAADVDADERVGAAGSLDDLFGEAEPPRKKRRGAGCLVAFLIVAAIVGGAVAGGLWVWNEYGERIMAQFGLDGPDDYEPGEATGEALITIEEGDTGSSISPKLFEAGVTLKESSFYDFLIRESRAPTFYPGTYRLQQRMTSEAVLAALEDPENKLEDTAQLREGLTVEASLPILSDGVGLPLEELQAAVADPSAYGVAADSLEGWLFPATYTFAPDATAEDVIRTLVERTVQSLDQAGVPEQDRQRILTVASIIQREARFEDDFYRVSRVIQNRLDDGNPETHGFLQMDSTAQYGYGEMHDGTASSSQEALEDDNPWNTYVRAGLPAGPIANPGDLAIDAAMHPADGPWLYFVTVNLDTGETVFTETYEEHQRAVEQWRAWCADNPDAGC